MLILARSLILRRLDTGLQKITIKYNILFNTKYLISHIMKYKFPLTALTILFTLSVSGCFMAKKSIVVENRQSFDSSSQARIRLYGSYGNTTIKRYNAISCEDWRTRAQKRAHHRVNNGLPKKIKNISAGLPVTERSLAASNDTGIMFRDSFKEFIVTANKPLTLDATEGYEVNNRYHSCRVAVSFLPKVNTDYEASYYEENHQCFINIREIQSQDIKPVISPTKALPAQDIQQCSKTGDRSI